MYRRSAARMYVKYIREDSASPCGVTLMRISSLTIVLVQPDGTTAPVRKAAIPSHPSSCLRAARYLPPRAPGSRRPGLVHGLAGCPVAFNFTLGHRRESYAAARQHCVLASIAHERQRRASRSGSTAQLRKPPRVGATDPDDAARRKQGKTWMSFLFPRSRLRMHSPTAIKWICTV